MEKLTRRDFLRICGVGTAGVSAALLAACSPSDEEPAKASTESATETSKEESKEQALTGGEATASADGKPSIVTVGVNVPETMSPFNWNPIKGSLWRECYQHWGERVALGSSDFRGVIMKEWIRVAEGEYEIELYDYITDHNGNKLTADDLVFSVEESRAKAVAVTTYIESCTATGDYTVTLKLTADGAGIFEQICETLWVFTKASYEASPDSLATAPVGTGPYKCTEYVAGNSLIFEKWDEYWQTEELNHPAYRANVDIIDCDSMKEATQIGMAVESDAVQLAYWITDSLVSQLQGLDGIEVEVLESIQVKTLMFNMMEDSVFYNNKALRECVCYAINNQQIVNNALYGDGSIPKTYGNRNAIGWNDEWENKGDYYSYDLDKAKAKLAEAGYKEGELTLRFLTYSGTTQENLTAVFQANMAAIGINLDIHQYEVNTYGNYLDATLGEYDLSNCDTSLLGPYLVQTYAYWLDAAQYSSGRTLFGLKDDALQELLHKCQSQDWTQADMDELNAMVVDNLWIYQWYANAMCTAHTDKLDVFRAFKGELIVGACAYNDWSYFKD